MGRPKWVGQVLWKPVFVLCFLPVGICLLSNVNVCFIFSFLSINRQGYLMDTQFLLGFKILWALMKCYSPLSEWA